MTHREGFSFIVWRGTFLRSDDTLELDSSVRSLPILACTRELPSLFFLFSSFSFFYLFFFGSRPNADIKVCKLRLHFPGVSREALAIAVSVRRLTTPMSGTTRTGVKPVSAEHRKGDSFFAFRQRPKGCPNSPRLCLVHKTRRSYRLDGRARRLSRVGVLSEGTPRLHVVGTRY
ncbi:hypothetical protein VUR80DRAFT_8224 [Thermomyces stellatus]